MAHPYSTPPSAPIATPPRGPAIPDEPAPPASLIAPIDLSDADYRRIAERLHRIAGIDLQQGKEGLVRSRLSQRLRALKLASIAEYITLIERDASGRELANMIDVLTTNKTSFFREIEHFRFLEDEVLPALEERGGPIRIWSAGCSSGEEPYSFAMSLRDRLSSLALHDARILATDISGRVLAHAHRAEYGAEAVAGVPGPLLPRHFEQVERHEETWRVVEPTRSLVRFARLNLMGEWPMHGPFDLIVCRNVMIYFDKSTQQGLVQRFTHLLRPGGYLFVGHSESLNSLAHELRYVRPAVYVR